MDVKGKEAKIPPAKLSLLPNSEIPVTRSAVTITFKIIYMKFPSK